MKILAIEASGGTAGCALAEDGKILGEYEVNVGRTHSQTLVPMLDALRRHTELDFSTVDAIAVTAGPGSFTGLRIGAATAKGMALALEKPILAVSTLESMAYNLYGTDALVCPIMDARRQQVYTAVYGPAGQRLPGNALGAAAGPEGGTEDTASEASAASADVSPAEMSAASADGSRKGTSAASAGGFRAEMSTASDNCFRAETGSRRPVCLLEPCAMAAADLIADLNARGRTVIFLGDGVPVYRAELEEQLTVPHLYAPGHLSLQRAASTALLAEQIFLEEGDAALESADDFRPTYLRRTQAEQQREKAEASGRMAALAAGRLVRETRAQEQ